MARDTSYSPDVEIDEGGRIVWARQIARGATITIPFHMWAQLRRQSECQNKLRPGVGAPNAKE